MDLRYVYSNTPLKNTHEVKATLLEKIANAESEHVDDSGEYDASTISSTDSLLD